MFKNTISRLYSAYSQKLIRFIVSRSGVDNDLAASIVQDTFISAWRSFSLFRHKSSYFTWLCKISLSKLSDYYRHQVHERSKIFSPTIDQLNSLISPELSLEEQLSLKELKQNVNKCLNLLPAKYRQLLHLKYYEQMSNSKISVTLNLSPRQVEGKLYRARHALAKLLNE